MFRPKIFRNRTIKRITIPKTVTKIEDGAFKNCSNLKEIVFEEGTKLEEIGDWCFWSSELKEITLPKTLKKIGSYTFDDYTNL